MIEPFRMAAIRGMRISAKLFSLPWPVFPGQKRGCPAPNEQQDLSFPRFISDRWFRLCRRCDEIRFAGQVDDTCDRQIRQKRRCRAAVGEESASALL